MEERMKVVIDNEIIDNIHVNFDEYIINDFIYSKGNEISLSREEIYDILFHGRKEEMADIGVTIDSLGSKYGIDRDLNSLNEILEFKNFYAWQMLLKVIKIKYRKDIIKFMSSATKYHYVLEIIDDRSGKTVS